MTRLLEDPPTVGFRCPLQIKDLVRNHRTEWRIDDPAGQFGLPEDGASIVIAVL